MVYMIILQYFDASYEHLKYADLASQSVISVQISEDCVQC